MLAELTKFGKTYMVNNIKRILLGNQPQCNYEL